VIHNYLRYDDNLGLFNLSKFYRYLKNASTLQDTYVACRDNLKNWQKKERSSSDPNKYRDSRGFALIPLGNKQAKPLFKQTSGNHNTSNVFTVLFIRVVGYFIR